MKRGPPPFHVKRVLSDASSLGLRLEAPQAQRLAEFTDLLRARAVPLGLVSERDASRLYERHVADSLRAAVVIGPEDRRAIDLGSGAGLPGLVVAAAVPSCHVALIEPRNRAAGFLELAIERLGLSNAEVAVARAEEVPTQVDVVLARAFAPLARSWAASVPLLRPGGRLIYFSGRRTKAPERDALALSDPEAPAEVRADPVVENAAPLVIMTRG